MKKLAILAGIVLLTLVFWGSFTTPTTSAQTSETDTSSAASYDYFSSQANTLLDNGINQLEKQKVARQSMQNSAEKTAGLASIDGYLSVLNATKSAYNTTFNQQRTSGVEAPKAQIAALVQGREAGNTIYASLGSRENDSFARPIYNAVFATTGGWGGLMSQAQKIGNGSLAVGSAGANALVNAGAVTKVGEGRTKEMTSETCSLIPMRLAPCITDTVTWLIKNVLLEIAGFLLWLTATMLNQAVAVGILNFKDWSPDTLYPIWIIVRQIISLIIVFVGLYLGFLYILGREDRFEKYIPWVVIFALFVNFSYPLVRTAVDVSNIVSLKIYTSALGGGVLTGDINSKDTAGAIIVSRLGLQGLVASAVDDKNSSGKLFGSVDSLPGALLTVVYVLYATYIFFIVSMVLIFRTAALSFIIMISPLLLVESVLPFLGEHAARLRKIFFEQLAVGPVFMIMLALTLKFLEVFSDGPLKSGATSTGTVVTFFNILMMLIMLHIMITVTRKVSGEVGSYGTKALGTFGGAALGAASGGAGFLARGTIGRVAAKARDSGWVSKDPNALSNRIAGTLASSSFDVRNSKVIAGGAKLAGLGTGYMGVGMGTGTKGSFDQTSKERMEKRLQKAARIKTKYEHDVLDAQGNIVKRKGDEIVEDEALGVASATARRNKILEGSSLFITKEQKNQMQDGAVDEESAKLMGEFKKQRGQKAREAYIADLKKKLQEAKKDDPTSSGVKSKALARAVFDAEKSNKEEIESFDKQVSEALDKIKELPEGDRQKTFLANLTKEVRDEVKAKAGIIDKEEAAKATSVILGEDGKPLQKGGPEPRAASSTAGAGSFDPERLRQAAREAREAAQKAREAAGAQAGSTASTNPSGAVPPNSTTPKAP